MEVNKKDKIKVLVVDDDRQFSEYLYELLINQDYYVVLADNGESGLAQYLSKSPDLIITDIVMPEKEGIEMIMTIRENDTKVPIVAVSGGNLGNADSYLNMAKKLGASVALVKPFSTKEILGTLKELLPC